MTGNSHIYFDGEHLVNADIYGVYYYCNKIRELLYALSICIFTFDLDALLESKVKIMHITATNVLETEAGSDNSHGA